MLRIGLIKEGKVPADNRVALTPAQCKWLIKNFEDISIIVEPSADRCYTDEEKYNLDPSFLMEVMELNEQVMELEEKENDNERNALKVSIKSALQNLQEEIYEPVKPLLANYSETTDTEKKLLQIKDYYFKQKYLKRIEEGLGV